MPLVVCTIFDSISGSRGKKGVGMGPGARGVAGVCWAHCAQFATRNCAKHLRLEVVGFM